MVTTSSFPGRATPVPGLRISLARPFFVLAASAGGAATSARTGQFVPASTWAVTAAVAKEWLRWDENAHAGIVIARPPPEVTLGTRGRSFQPFALCHPSEVRRQPKAVEGLVSRFEPDVSLRMHRLDSLTRSWYFSATVSDGAVLRTPSQKQQSCAQDDEGSPRCAAKLRTSGRNENPRFQAQQKA